MIHESHSSGFRRDGSCKSSVDTFLQHQIHIDYIEIPLYDWQFTANQFVLVTSPFRLATSNFIFLLNTRGYSPYVTSSLIRGWVCRLQLLLLLASTIILRSKSCGTHDHILLSQIQHYPSLEGQVLIFISPRNMVAQLYPRHWVPLLLLPMTQGYSGGIWPCLRTGSVSSSSSITAYICFARGTCLPNRCLLCLFWQIRGVS
jgi:hypothetical protein